MFWCLSSAWDFIRSMKGSSIPMTLIVNQIEMDMSTRYSFRKFGRRNAETVFHDQCFGQWRRTTNGNSGFTYSELRPDPAAEFCLRSAAAAQREDEACPGRHQHPGRRATSCASTASPGSVAEPSTRGAASAGSDPTLAASAPATSTKGAAKIIEQLTDHDAQAVRSLGTACATPRPTPRRRMKFRA